jgi:multicomponent Na+:H+ antiporter subunit B
MKGLTLIVKTIADFVAGFIVVFGAYIVLFGHLTPGGGFAGGVIIAGAFVLLMLAHGSEVALSRFGLRTASILDSVGVGAFLAIAWLGMIGGLFFQNFFPKGTQFRLLSSGTILPYNIAIAFKVMSSLFLVFAVLSMFRRRSVRRPIEPEDVVV